MRYLNQDAVAKRLGLETKKMLRDRVELPAAALVRQRIAATREDVATYASMIWSQHGGHGGPHFAAPAKRRILDRLDQDVRGLRRDLVDAVRTTRLKAYDLQYMASHWILDQVTPPNITVRPSAGYVDRYEQNKTTRVMGKNARLAQRRAREAFADEDPQGEPQADGDASPEQRTDGWLKAWHGSVLANLAIAAVQGDDGQDVAGRILDAKAGGMDLGDVMGRLIQTQVQIAIADADDDVDEVYKDLLMEPVWQILDDERVCPECEANAGLSRDEIDDEIPLHPLCRCWWRLVPRDWRDMSDEPFGDIGPRSMVFRNPVSGEPEGVVIVEFDRWAQALRG